MGNEHNAVKLLDRFTKTFCRDITVKNDLVFKCDECPFSHGDFCSVKEFKCKYEPDYKDFGAMGDF